jgi:hypothetical protein
MFENVGLRKLFRYNRHDLTVELRSSCTVSTSPQISFASKNQDELAVCGMLHVLGNEGGCAGPSGRAV